MKLEDAAALYSLGYLEGKEIAEVSLNSLERYPASNALAVLASETDPV